MIDITIGIPRYGWSVLLHCAVSCYHTDIILGELADIGCPEEYALRATRIMECGRLNTGLTYSNLRDRISVVVVARTSSATEFQNSLQHELRHLVDDIAVKDRITDKEEVAYLTGEINRIIFPFVSPLLCRKS